MISINVTIKGENMTEVVEKANEFIADGYKVTDLRSNDNEEEGIISLEFESEVSENEESNNEKYPSYREE